MKRRILSFAVLLTAALLLTGCAMRTVEEMYALPKRSEEYSNLQSAIDSAMVGLEYSAPISGENQQSVQTADLDGDGTEEYLVFTAGSWDKPLEVLIFRQEQDGSCVLLDVIESNGAAFEQVEYVEFDDKPGLDIIIGCQVSDQVLRSVSVYSLEADRIQQLLLVGYSRFLTSDFDRNGSAELMVIRPGEGENKNGAAVLYSSQKGQIQRSVEAELSAAPGQIKRIQSGSLESGEPAVYLSSSVETDKILTDIITLKRGTFSNIAASAPGDTTVETLRNFFVYPEDIDEDDVTELPAQLPIRPVSIWHNDAKQSLLRWFSLDLQGREVDKLYTFHNFLGGWYLRLDSGLAKQISVVQGDDVYSFYIWTEDLSEAVPVFSIFTFTGSSRNEQAAQDGRFLLYRSETAVYAAKLEPGAQDFGITQEYLTESFRLIRQDRRMN